MQATILIVDDEPLVRKSVREILADAGYATIEARDGEACLAALSNNLVDVVLMDIQMPGPSGLETFKRMVQQTYRVETIMISGHGTIETAVEALKCGAVDFLEKPFSAVRLRDAVAAALRKVTQRRESAEMARQGWKIGDYTVEREIGQGATAAIYKARQSGIDRTVALKVLHRFLTTDEGFRRRFQREAKVLRSLNHPNIISVYDAGEAEGTCYLAMEYVEGEPLGAFLEGSRCLPLTVGMAAGVMVCRALEHAHAQGILHRDIKPQNVIVSKRGEVKLVDFGLATWMQGAVAAMTTPGITVGTPQFMSPEQIEGREAGTASDIFSLGVLLYLVTTLHFPFPGENLATVLNAIVGGARREPRKLNRLMSEPESDLIMRCLCADPLQRFASAVEVRLALQAALGLRGVENATTAMGAHFRA